VLGGAHRVVGISVGEQRAHDGRAQTRLRKAYAAFEPRAAKRGKTTASVKWLMAQADPAETVPGFRPTDRFSDTVRANRPWSRDLPAQLDPDQNCP
jgi:hypothetical protein